LIFLFKWVQ
jgi:ubiquitin carboxyl-terminal hydrolase L5